MQNSITPKVESRGTMESNILDNKSLVGYCGLNCTKCIMYKGEIADLARDLRKVLRKEKFDKLMTGMPFIKNYEQCYETLGQMVKLRCKRACRGGGGNPGCNIRRCCQRQGFEICSECPDYADCAKLAKLTKYHGGDTRHIDNLERIQKIGFENWLNKEKFDMREDVPAQST